MDITDKTDEIIEDIERIIEWRKEAGRTSNTELLTVGRKAQISWYDPEVINAAEALKRLDGDETLLGDVLWEFITILPHRMEKLKGALEAEDAELAEQVAYSIKGAAWVVGADSMVDNAFRIELAATNRDLSRVGMLYRNLCNEFARVRVVLSGIE